MSDVYRPLPVTEEHLRALGLVVVESSVLELFLQLTYAMLYGMNEEERREKVVIKRISDLVREIREAAPERLSSDDAAALLKILEPVGDIVSERHDVIHGIWIKSDDGRVGVGVMRGGRRVGGRAHEKTPADLLKLVSKIRVSGHALQEFIKPRGGLKYIGISLPEPDASWLDAG